MCIRDSSYTGNPLACRAALATLDVFEQQDWMARVRLLGQFLWSATASLRSHRYVAEVRQQGLILAVELARRPQTREAFPAAERRGLRAYRHALATHKDFGVLLRPLGDILYFMPPYVIEPREVEAMARIACEAIDYATQDD